MPVPARNLNHNAPVFNRTAKEGSKPSVEQGDDPSGKMHGVCPRKNDEDHGNGKQGQEKRQAGAIQVAAIIGGTVAGAIIVTSAKSRRMHSAALARLRLFNRYRRREN